MIYTYLFEAKAVQSYLFQGNKLKDLISASERLDRMIDESHDSLLFHVLEAANLEHDLITATKSNESVRFLRCKGGAFYAFSTSKDALVKLREAWTLTLSQLFPTLVYVDALNHGDSLSKSLEAAMKGLGADRNLPQVNFPIATAITERYSRTGNPSTKLSALAKKSSPDERANDSGLDLDTDLHRQALSAWNLKDASALTNRFTPEGLRGLVKFPIEFEDEFPFVGSKDGLSKREREAIKDMALIHIDGNGLGVLLRKLQDKLKDKSDDVFASSFRMFSTALNRATLKAAQIATQNLYDRVSQKSEHDISLLPMRPVVLGGDDVTLFCRADLAMTYANDFCSAFKSVSKDELNQLYQQHLKGSGIEPFMTASGGVLYHKASHPFMACHQMVEALCLVAKKLTKSVHGDQSDKVGPAALAFYRITSSTHEELESIYNQSQNYQVIDDNSKETINVSISQLAYFVDENTDHERHIDNLAALMKLSQQPGSPVSMAKWRQMATHLSRGDLSESKRVFSRAKSLADAKDAVALEKIFLKLSANKQNDWLWLKESESSRCLYQTPINDLLVLEHFQPVKIEGPQACEERI